MDEPWFYVLHTKMIQKMRQILIKTSFNFLSLSQYFYSWLLLHYLIYLAPVLFSLLGVSHSHYLPSGCSSFYFSPSRFPLRTLPLFPQWVAHFFPASLRPLSEHAVLLPPQPPGAPPACDLSYLPLHHQHLTQCLPCSKPYVNICQIHERMSQ